MKNTRKYLNSGVALAIVLFASVQISAAPVNRFLSREIKAKLEADIKENKEVIQDIETSGMANRQSPLYNPSEVDHLAIHKKVLGCLENMYYGNKSYTEKDIQECWKPHSKLGR
jgi:hypothetical protein